MSRQFKLEQVGGVGYPKYSFGFGKDPSSGAKALVKSEAIANTKFIIREILSPSESLAPREYTVAKTPSSLRYVSTLLSGSPTRAVSAKATCKRAVNTPLRKAVILNKKYRGKHEQLAKKTRELAMRDSPGRKAAKVLTKMRKDLAAIRKEQDLECMGVVDLVKNGCARNFSPGSDYDLEPCKRYITTAAISPARSPKASLSEKMAILAVANAALSKAKKSPAKAKKSPAKAKKSPAKAKKSQMRG